MAALEYASVSLDGELDIQTIVRAHAVMLEAFQTQDAVVLDITGVTSVDLTFIQLIEAARVTAVQTGKTFKLTAAAPEPVVEALQRSCLLTTPSDERTAFWLPQ